MEPQRSISDVAFAEGRRLAGDPNICAVGHGAKLRAGLPVGAQTLVFMVREKLPSAEAIRACGSWPVPPEIGGFVTDVVAVGGLAAAAADRQPPVGARGIRAAEPLVGGFATAAVGPAAPSAAGYGTLGGLVFDGSTQSPLLLSNAHVWGLSAGTEVVEPIMASEWFGAPLSPALVPGGAPALVQSRIPTVLVPPVVFANAFAHMALLTGGGNDPLVLGQAATPVPATTATVSEAVSLVGPSPGLPPAGRRLTPAIASSYRRLTTTAPLDATLTAPPTQTGLLTAHRLFTDASAYAGTNLVQLYAEVIPAPGQPLVASAHYALVFLYPMTAGIFVPRALQPTTRRTPATITTTFQGFPAPARAGAAALPVTVGSFTVDGGQPGTFVTPAAGVVPAGSFVLKLPATAVRIFVPPSTRIDVDIDLRGTSGTLQTAAVDSTGATVASGTVAAGTSGRSTLSFAASEIVEISIAGLTGAQLVGMTSKHASPETTAPLAYAGTALASDLAAITKGKWAGSLFVQALSNGLPESANVIERAIGSPSLVVDCTFDVN